MLSAWVSMYCSGVISIESGTQAPSECFHSVKKIMGASTRYTA